MADPVISLSGICKQFSTVQANSDVDFNVFPGRVHALLGENGAGKSTLMSILAGRYKADSGTISIRGRKTIFTSPAQSLQSGIGMVYQRFMLIESMSVADNLFLAARKKLGKKDLKEVLEKTAEDYGLHVDADKSVFELSMGERQRVEIVKLLILDADVLIFDEPTAVLTPPEIEGLFSVLDRLRQKGKAIVFITHKLEEVLRLADDISIMRKGRLILTSSLVKKNISKRQLARLMVGRDVVLRVNKKKVEPGKAVLSLKQLSGHSPTGGAPFTNVSFEIRQGEIFSIIGVAGNGQSALVSTIAGLARASSGRLNFLGKDYTVQQWFRTPKKQIAYVPEDRYHTGCVGSMSIADNFALTRLSAYATGRPAVFLDRRKLSDDGDRIIDAFNIKAESYNDRADSLSGGNLQKVILARELAREPKLFIAEQPTQGLDISATEEIWQALLNCREKAAVLLVTGDLKEVLSLSDRIAVIFAGRILEIIDATDVDGVERVGLLMAGVKP